MKHSATRDLYCYWDKLRCGRSAPDRSEIDPAKLKDVLADTFILEMDEERRYPFRLAGTRLCALMGFELRGSSFVDIFKGEDVVEIERLLLAVAEEAAAIVIGLDAQSNQGHSVELELIILPLRHRSASHSRVLGSLTPSEQPYWLGVCPLKSVLVRSIRVLWPASRDMFDPRPLQPAMPEGVRRVGHLRVLEGGRV